MHECGLDLAGTACGQPVLLGRDAHGRDADVPEHLVRLAESFSAPRWQPSDTGRSSGRGGGPVVPHAAIP